MMRIQSVFLVFSLFTLFLFSGCKSKQIVQNNFLTGIWVGEAYQFDIEESWTIEFRANVEEKIYTIAYPSLSCGGNLTLEGNPYSTWLFRESLYRGLDICTNGGRIVLEKVDDDSVNFSYYWPDDSVLSASGILKRSK